MAEITNKYLSYEGLSQYDSLVYSHYSGKIKIVESDYTEDDNDEVNRWLKRYDIQVIDPKTKNKIDTIGTINIPTDLVVTKGEVVTFTDTDNADDDETAYAQGKRGTFLKLTIANQKEPVYIDVKKMFDIFTVEKEAKQVQLALDPSTNQLSATVVHDSITVIELGDNAVETLKIKDAAVTTAKIADSNVTTAKINDAAVTVDKLATDSVSTAKIINENVTVDKLATNSVSTVKIIDANVTEPKLAVDSVTTAKIVNKNVTTAKIDDSAVTTIKIEDSAVTTAKIDNSAVITEKIADKNVTTAKINDAAVIVDKLATDSVSTDKIINANVTEPKLAVDSVTTAKIVNKNVTNEKIADTTIARGKIDTSFEADIKALEDFAAREITSDEISAMFAELASEEVDSGENFSS